MMQKYPARNIRAIGNLRHVRAALESIWNNRRTAHTLIALTLVTCWYYIRHTPPPGYAVAVLAFVAAIMSVRENSPAQKFLWLLSMSLLLGIEFHAIRLDRQTNEAQQEKRFKDQMEQFTSIGQGIKDSIKVNQRHFEETMDSAKSILGTTQDVAVMAKGSLEELTGANSFPFVVPQPANDGSTAPLAVWDAGKNMLTNVAITIHSSSDYTRGDDVAFLSKSENEIGVLHPGWPRMLKEVIVPRFDTKDGIDIYDIQMYTQHELYTEVLQFRKASRGRGWATRYWVLHHKFYRRMGATVPICGSSRWSDEPPPKDRTQTHNTLKPCLP